MNPGCGDDLVARFEAADETLVIFLFLLLWADEQKVENDKDEDEGEEVHQHIGLLRSPFGQQEKFSKNRHGSIWLRIRQNTGPLSIGNLCFQIKTTK